FPPFSDQRREVPFEIREEALKDAATVTCPEGAPPKLPSGSVGRKAGGRPDGGTASQRRHDGGLDGCAARDAVVESGGWLSMIGQHVEIVAVLWDTADDAGELSDRVVHPSQRAERQRMRGPEGVSEDVVLKIVHVHRRRAAIEVGGRRQREELAGPDGETDL